ncbi:hypothetical protein GJ744_002042 [Endocarpon pusillum]|uniref:Uncharacterized protein n=1 Tax=Endocarpon pusillum TaxID=364733 RepID=A0A8H7A8J3_9EURO|nr:hypothetical protein GJ744_002042 [Endocarpon pusillum]
MPPQATPTPFASEIGSSIYQTASPTGPVVSSVPTAPASSDDTDRNGHAWSNYLYIVVIFAVVFLLGLLYRRKRRNLAASTFPRNRFQAFHTHHPSQSRDLSAVQANNRVWRNMRAGPFSHHARMDSAGTRRPGTSGTGSRSRVDLDEEVPPPYVVAEPERTLDRGPSTRETRGWSDRRTRGDLDMNDLLREREAGSINKPPGYQERDITRRDG